MPNRIDNSDPQLWTVKAFFEAVSDHNFSSVMVEVLSGRNYGINDAGCEFPTAEDPFEGVRFWVLHDEVIISVAEFHRFVREACAAQAKRLPQQADALEAVLAKLPPTAP